MVNLRNAKIEEAEDILKLYHSIINSIEGTEFKPKWGESYPNLEFIETSIKNQELYVCTIDGNIIACVVLNNRFSPEYDDADWIINAKPSEIVMIHAFAVNSDFAGKGIGKEIFNQIKNNSIRNNQKTIRLDIINGNVGAQKVFEKFGFEYIDTIEVFHSAVGLEKFHLYEYILKN